VKPLNANKVACRSVTLSPDSISTALVQGTGLVTDALDSSKMTLMPSTTCNKANFHSQDKRSLAKVCGAAESGLSLLGAML